MSCQDIFDKYPYTYSCCPDSIDGITIESLQEMWENGKDPEGYHLPCLKCGKEYHIYKLGLKWTERIFTQEEIVSLKAMKEKFYVEESEKVKPAAPGKVIFTMEDILELRCIVCKEPAFKNESYEIKDSMLHLLNSMIAPQIEASKGLITKEMYMQTLANMKKNPGCRACSEKAKQRMSTGKYN